MSVRPLDTLLAFKAILLMPGVPAAEMRIAAVIIDHYRRRDGRCDPSIETITILAQMDRTTVLRALRKLERRDLIFRARHGGRHLCNNYEPNWTKFREAEANWKARRKQARRALSVANRPDLEGQERHLSSGDIATQTCLRNLSKEPVCAGAAPRRETSKGQAEGNRARCKSNTDSREAAAVAAERRWSAHLHELLSPDPVLYGAVIDAIDDSLRTAATEAEVRRRGGGLRVIFGKLACPGGLPKLNREESMKLARLQEG